MKLKAVIAASVTAFMLSTAAGDALAQAKKTEIRIGQTLPYSGPASSFSVIGRSAEAYFNQLNKSGGINGRTIKFISLDDHYSPPKTVEHTRKLVEQDEVDLIFGTLGTPTNNAIHRYLNGKKVPHLFLLTGATKWADPKNFPWTMAGMAAYESEGVVYAKNILKTKPDAKIAVLMQNDDMGRDYLAGFKRGLGDKAKSMIVYETTYEQMHPTIASQISLMRASGADVVFGITIGKFTTQLIKGMADIGWKPEQVYIPTSAASLAFLEPAGLDNSVGLLTASYQKDVNDPQWAESEDIKAYQAFMKEMLPTADVRNTNYATGWANAQLLAHVLRAAGDDLSRENILKQATSIKDLVLPITLPGIKVNTSSTDYLPFQQLRMRRFDGKSWQGFGEILDDQ